MLGAVYPANFGRSNCVSAEITETSVQRHFGPEISVSVSAGRPDGRYGTNDDVVTINLVSSTSTSTSSSLIMVSYHMLETAGIGDGGDEILIIYLIERETISSVLMSVRS